MKLRAGFALGLVVVALLACKKKEESTSSGSTGTTAEAIGVPECDEYLTKYEKCVKDKVPEASRAQMEATLKQTRETYKKLADNPVTKAGLPASCKQAMEALKTSMSAFGCTF